jgi:hypothetical protein
MSTTTLRFGAVGLVVALVTAFLADCSSNGSSGSTSATSTSSTGTGTGGGRCVADADCRSTAVIPNPVCVKGACGCAEDDDCNGSSVPNAVCRDMTCVNGATSGPPCKVDSDCDDVSCGNTACYCIESMCLPGQDLGGPCENDNDCFSVACVGNRCVSPQPDGAPCKTTYECKSMKCFNGECGLVANGSPCSQDSECKSLRCSGGTCQAPVPPGSPCMQDLDCTCPKNVNCEVAFCYEGTCAGAALATGAACQHDAECDSLTCTNGACACLPSGANLSNVAVAQAVGYTFDAACCSGAWMAVGTGAGGGAAVPECD